MDTQTTQQSQQQDERAPLWKQLLGAGVGMLVALALYNAYEFATPRVQAYIFPPGTSQGNPPSGQVTVSDKTLPKKENHFTRIAARAQEIAKRLTTPEPSAAPEAMNVEESAAPVEEEKPAAPAEQTLAERVQARLEARLQPVDDPDAVQNVTQEAAKGAHAAPSATKKEESVMAEVGDAAHAGAPKLPSSGITLWLAALMALGASTMMMPKVRSWAFHRA